MERKSVTHLNHEYKSGFSYYLVFWGHWPLDSFVFDCLWLSVCNFKAVCFDLRGGILSWLLFAQQPLWAKYTPYPSQTSVLWKMRLILTQIPHNKLGYLAMNLNLIWMGKAAHSHLLSHLNPCILLFYKLMLLCDLVSLLVEVPLYCWSFRWLSELFMKLLLLIMFASRLRPSCIYLL